MAQRDTSQCCHHQLIVVDPEIGFLEVRGHFELTRCDFVVTRGDRHTELIQLELCLGDTALDSLRNSAEVVILELLATRRRCADESAAPHHQVRSQPEVTTIDEEVFLLGTECGEDALHTFIAEEIEQIDRFLGQNVGAAQKRRHLVERLSVVADED